MQATELPTSPPTVGPPPEGPPPDGLEPGLRAQTDELEAPPPARHPSAPETNVPTASTPGTGTAEASTAAGASPSPARTAEASAPEANASEASTARPGSHAEHGPAAVSTGAPPKAERRVRPSAAGTLLAETSDWSGLARRAAAGAGLSMAYGVALGAREGGLDLLLHAVGVPTALLAVTLLGLPALYIVLALFNAPLSLVRAGSAAARGIASAGIVLAGLSPLAALFVVTSSSSGGAAIAGGLGLCVGGALGLRHLASTLSDALREADSATRMIAGLAQLGFVFFAGLLAWRVWGALLPLLGGA